MRKLVFLGLMVVAWAAVAEQPVDLKIVDGACTGKSHIARGPIGEDLTKNRAKFKCDSAVVSFFDHENKHIMIQFAQKKSKDSKHILGFSGYMRDDGVNMDVHRVYIEGSEKSVEEGYCKLFFKSSDLYSIACGAPIDEVNNRTVPVVVFDAK